MGTVAGHPNDSQFYDRFQFKISFSCARVRQTIVCSVSFHLRAAILFMIY